MIDILELQFISKSVERKTREFRARKINNSPLMFFTCLRCCCCYCDWRCLREPFKERIIIWWNIGRRQSRTSRDVFKLNLSLLLPTRLFACDSFDTKQFSRSFSAPFYSLALDLHQRNRVNIPMLMVVLSMSQGVDDLVFNFMRAPTRASRSRWREEWKSRENPKSKVIFQRWLAGRGNKLCDRCRRGRQRGGTK